MNELERRMSEARGRIRLDWPEERADRNRRAVQQRHRRRSAGRAAALVLAVLGLGLATERAWRHPGGPLVTGTTRRAPPEAAPRPGGPVPAAPGAAAAAPLQVAGAPLRFRDGSLATLLTRESRLVAMEDTPGRMLVQLQGGGARFDVVHNPARVFRVDARDAAVEVLGTRFTMERIGEGADRRVRVAVESGRVRVLWDGGYAELTDGQSDVFPRPREAASARGAEGPRGEPLHEPPPGPAPRRRGAGAAERAGEGPAGAHDRRDTWRALAQEGQFEQAYSAIDRGPLSEISDQPGDLLILADVARLSRHPAQAVAPLRKVVRGHPGDPRAPLAAFTLGRVLLDDLGRPAEAAEAFQQAQALDPAGPMAQDALAREVEAWSRAGDAPRARERAEDYVRRYPDGRRLRSVRRYGGLE